MNLLTILGIAIGLAMDAFAVSIASSVLLSGASARQTFRIAFHFGFFQFMMPVIGWLAGGTVAPFVVEWDHWVAFALLAFVGGRSIAGALRGDERGAERGDPSRGLTLILLSIATSIDALAVGLSFAFLRVEIWYPSVIIGLVTGALSVVGMRVAGRLGARFGRRIEFLGGLILLAIGLKILAEHLL